MADQDQGQVFYNVDIVMCIDGTGSMRPIIEEVKANALTFHEEFQRRMDIEGKTVDSIRVKIIVFRDYGRDGTDAMVETKFFNLPAENDEFSAFINSIEAFGGGDIPENGLEAIALALKSDWTTAPGKKRHVVLMFTDAPALAFGERAGEPNYPAGMPADLAELGDWWAGMAQLDSTYDPRWGRLIIFAPEATPWSEMDGWNKHWYTRSAAGTGLEELDMEDVYTILVGSM